MADQSLLERLRAIALSENKSLAEVIREGMELRADRHRPPLSFVGAFSSGHTDTSERVDELIHEWLSRKHDL